MVKYSFIKESNLNEALLVSFKLLSEVWKSGDYKNIEEFIEAVEINNQIMDIEIHIEDGLFSCQAIECFSEDGYHCRGYAYHFLWKLTEEEIERRL